MRLFLLVPRFEKGVHPWIGDINQHAAMKILNSSFR
jgi:hypothetical protein